MSVTDLSSAADLSPSPSSVAPPQSKGTFASTWFRVGLACAILLASGGTRLWQSRRIDDRIARGSKPAFDLNEIPMNLGSWKGQATTIDPIIARATGADMIVTRRYINQDTGVAVDMILLFGPAVDMFIHLPEICYPAAGFSEIEEARICPIKSGSENVTFRSMVYGKGEGAATDLQEVYYTWRYEQHWSPDVGQLKDIERIPGMYKVQLARRVGSGERREVGNPCEAFLKELVPEMDRRLNPLKSEPSGSESKPLVHNH